MTRWIDRQVFGEKEMEFFPANLEVIPKFHEKWEAGSLPCSWKLPEIKLYRYQNKNYLDLGDTWYRMVWDIQHKWGAVNRYAGKDIAPGHYFSLSKAGAQAEMQAYGANFADYELLEFTVSIDNLLDLTSPDCLKSFYDKHFLPDRDWSWAMILDSMFGRQTGGDTHTSFAGQKALQDGYNGIVFFGVRAIESYWADPGGLSIDFNLADENRDAMCRNADCINVVIYFGHNVIRSTRRIRCTSGEMENKYFSCSMAEIDDLFSADITKPAGEDLSYETLLGRVRDKVWLSIPKIVEIDAYSSSK